MNAKTRTERLTQAHERGYLVVRARYRDSCTAAAADHDISGTFFNWCERQVQPYARILTREAQGIAYVEVDFVSMKPSSWAPPTSESFLVREARLERAREEARAIVESYPFAAIRVGPMNGRRTYGFGTGWWHVDRCPIELADEVMQKLLAVAPIGVAV